MTTKFRVSIALCVGVIAGLLPSPSAMAASTSHLAAQRIDNDSFDNYDFTSPSVSSTNVDWPVTYIFFHNAAVDKVKVAMGGVLTYAGGAMYGRMDNSFGWFYDQDGGRKDLQCSYGTYDSHYRIYADGSNGDRNWSPNWGFYTIATTHRDVNECGGGTTSFGWSETAEGAIASVARWAFGSNAVWEDAYDFNNYENSRWEGNHFWNNGGTGTEVYVG